MDAKQIITEIKQGGVSIAEIARMTGLTPQGIRKIYSGRVKDTRVSTLCRLIEARKYFQRRKLEECNFHAKRTTPPA